MIKIRRRACKTDSSEDSLDIKKASISLVQISTNPDIFSDW